MQEDKRPKIIRPQAGFQENFVRSNVDVCFGGGVLNPQPIDSYVITPYGERRLADMQPGDTICDVNGGVQVINHIINKGKMQCVRFMLDDGRTVESALEHHWKVFNRHGKELDITALDIMNYIDSRKDYPKKHKDWYRIPNSAPVYYEDLHKEERKIDAYLLGYLIGNGCFREKDLVCFCTSDESVAQYIESLGYTLKTRRISDNYRVYSIQSKELKNEIRNLELMGVHADKKFIPDSYKYAPINIRLGVLQGLMDSDGCAIRTNFRKYRCTYVSVSKTLIEDVKEIIYSLGGKCYTSITPRCKRFLNNRTKISDCKESYRLTIHLPNNKDLFRLKRKKDLAQNADERRVKPFLSIKSYELIGEKECKCINVSGNEHLYLTDNFIITRNCGKTFASILATAEMVKDPNFRGVFVRKSFPELKSAGGVFDEFKAIFKDNAQYKNSDPPRVTFPSGAFVEFRQVNNEDLKKIQEEWKGSQYTYIYIDEATSIEFSTFKYLRTRNRSKSTFHPCMKATMNPERECWIRPFIDWYVGEDGRIIPERDGVIRYFYIWGNDPTEVYWGDTKEEVYRLGRTDIDRKLRALGGDFTYENLISSFVFYLGKMSENKASVGKNMDYAASVASVGGHQAEQFIEGNWNASCNDNTDLLITPTTARACEFTTPQKSHLKYVTVDLADIGKDNTNIFVFEGLHLVARKTLQKSTPAENCRWIRHVAREHDIPENHIIYDAQRAAYVLDYIPDAIPYISGLAPRGVYKNNFRYMKDECYMRLINAINDGRFSISPEVAHSQYKHQKIRTYMTFMDIFIDECKVINFTTLPNGKLRLDSKKKMNSNLTVTGSMDILDACAMLMSAYCDVEYGEELQKGYKYQDNDDIGEFSPNVVNIFDDSTWC